MLERRHETLLPKKAFYRRLAGYGAVSLGFILGSLIIGILGYRHFEGMTWVDAYVNAAMILGGMGPVGEFHTSGGKIFAGCYALYSGLIVIDRHFPHPDPPSLRAPLPSGGEVTRKRTVLGGR